jgi:23S rRNA pseudouridine1911/1915/1917 synthase
MRYTVTEDQGARLDRWLTERVGGRARNQIQHDIEAGLVRVGGAAAPARHKVAEGEVIDYDMPAPLDTRLRPESIPLDIVYEDADMLVLDKPAGMVVHPAPGHDGGTVANALLGHCGPSLEGVGGEGRWGIIHRLDSLTSGLMMAAKTPAAYEALVAALAERRVHRQYAGIVIGSFKVDQGMVDRPIGRRVSDRKKMGILTDGRPSRTDWSLVCQSEGLALLGLTLHSGRTHQIRVHMQSVGHPVLADPDYGWTKPRTLQEMTQSLRPRLAAIWPERQMLHAALLSLEHPLDPARRRSFQSTLPADMRLVLDLLWPGVWEGAWTAWVKANQA